MKINGFRHFGKLRLLILSNTFLVVFILLALVWSLFLNWQFAKINMLESERYYNNLTGAIVEYYAQQKQAVSFIDVKQTLKLLDKYVPEYFPGGDFKVNDFIALAIIESDFNKYCIGAHGERGMFQILAWKTILAEIDRPLDNPFDIEINIKMSCYVLKNKYAERKTYRDAIIGYNGYIVDSEGQVIDKYWHRFNQALKLVHELKERSKEI